MTITAGGDKIAPVADDGALKKKTLTITAGGDKIAPVADDGALKKPQEIMSAGDAEAEQPGM